MFGVVIILLLGVAVIFYRKSLDEVGNEKPSKLAMQLDRLWVIAQDSLREKKYLRAEKALLTILRADERNARAYNRLGILYAKQRQYEDAIECFEIAQSLEPSASSLHNVGLIYYETGKYDKAAQAFEQALQMEEDVAARHVAYAKVLEQTDHKKKMIEELERAVELEPNPQLMGILADAYEKTDQLELAESVRAKARRLVVPEGAPKRIRQPRKVVM